MTDSKRETAQKSVDKLTSMYLANFILDIVCDDNGKQEEIVQDPELFPFFSSAVAYGVSKGYLEATGDLVAPDVKWLMELTCGLKAMAELDELLNNYEDNQDTQNKLAMLGLTKDIVQRVKAKRKESADAAANGNPDASTFPNVANRPGGPADWLNDGYARN